MLDGSQGHFHKQNQFKKKNDLKIWEVTNLSENMTQYRHVGQYADKVKKLKK